MGERQQWVRTKVREVVSAGYLALSYPAFKSSERSDSQWNFLLNEHRRVILYTESRLALGGKFRQKEREKLKRNEARDRGARFGGARIGFPFSEIFAR